MILFHLDCVLRCLSFLPSNIFFSTCVLFFLSYVVWIFYIAYVGGFWVYPVLEYLDIGQRALFILVCAVFALCLYIVGEYCNYIAWGKQPQTVKEFKSNSQEELSDQENSRKKGPRSKQKYY